MEIKVAMSRKRGRVKMEIKGGDSKERRKNKNGDKGGRCHGKE